MALEHEDPAHTSAGNGVDEPRIAWGINRWVLVEAGSDHFQGQVSAPRELESMLLEAGVDKRRAHELAVEQWRERPLGAGLRAASAGGAVWRSTGLSRLGSLVVLLAVAAVFFVALLFGIR